ncbi:MFS transporter, YNFM family, putative membrane transport protein [Formivibrio citricus]|uniref:MFS transporter, YNFM family, putative membrane transport protein n=2 Tax=Formivibrio citricus TaxID=83765 RepID=A0A1I4YKY4_9NEIS|nr:MFS transporter, YNFM family, putative membrane transport protein [Formivibrio citricus]
MVLGGFATFALLYGMQPLMPAFSQQFHVSPAAASGVISAATGAMALSLIPASLLANRFGRKTVMSVSLMLSALLTLLSAVAVDFQQLVILRALLGVALAGLPAVAMAYLSEEIDPDVLGRAIGLYIAGNALGGMCGRFAMAILADHFSWRVATLVLGGAGLLSAIEFWRSLPESRNFQPSGVTVKRTMAAARRHFSDAGLPWLFLTGFILMGCFVSLFNYLAYRLAAAPYGYSQSQISVIYSLNAAGIVASPWAGRLADRFGRRNVLWIMALCMLAGLVLTLASPIALIYLGTAVFSFGFFGGHSIASSWLGFRAVRNKALATALYLSIYYLGSSCLGSVTGFMWNWAQWNGVVLLLGVFLLASFAVALKLRKLAPRLAS